MTRETLGVVLRLQVTPEQARSVASGAASISPGALPLGDGPPGSAPSMPASPVGFVLLHGALEKPGITSGAS